MYIYYQYREGPFNLAFNGLDWGHYTTGLRLVFSDRTDETVFPCTAFDIKETRINNEEITFAIKIRVISRRYGDRPFAFVLYVNGCEAAISTPFLVRTKRTCR